MAPHLVEGLCEGEGDLQVVRALLEPVEAAQQLGRIAVTGFEIRFNELELAIQPEDAVTHAPPVHSRREAQQRINDADERNEDEEGLGYERGEPKRQIALQERTPGLVELLRICRHGQVAGLRRRKLSGVLKELGTRVDLCCRVEQQVLQRRVDVVADDKTRLHREQLHVGGGAIGRQVADPHGHDELRQIGIERDVRVDAREVE